VGDDGLLEEVAGHVVEGQRGGHLRQRVCGLDGALPLAGRLRFLLARLAFPLLVFLFVVF
jgi:hypothetical protein